MGIAALMKARAARRAGITLLELMIATAIISIGVLGMVGAFNYINRGVQGPKGRSLANNLAQEKIEVLKNKSYFRVLVTTQPATDENFGHEYDAYPNGSETLNVGGINFNRRVMIKKASESGGVLNTYAYTVPDTGLKEVTVYVTWMEGASWRKVELRNLIGNPNRTNLSARFSGRVCADAGCATPIEGATVRAQENLSRFAVTDADGDYSLDIEPGEYRLQASKTGYFQSISPVYDITTTQTHNFTLTPMLTGSVSGSAWLRDHLVISQVVAATETTSGVEIEYVELYNPTTYTITVCDSGTGENYIKLRYFGENGAGQDQDPLAYTCNMFSTTVGPGKYYLISNSVPVKVGGGQPNPNGLFATSNGTLFGGRCGYTNTVYLNCIRKEKAGAIQLYDSAGVIDTVGWTNDSAGKPAPVYEGFAKALPNGFGGEAQLVRYTSAGTVTAATGRAYDANSNSNDFHYGAITQRPYALYSWDAAYQPVTGSPAGGALVFANDGLSASTQAAASGNFTLTGVATGYWTLFVSSGVNLSTGGTYGGTTSGFSAQAGEVVLSSANSFGFVSGRVTGAAGGGLSGILMSAGGRQAYTLANGRYILPADPGTQTVFANYQTADTDYIELSSGGVEVALGEPADDVDFTLLTGGRLMGWVTTNGTDPLPNVPVSAFKNGVEQGNGISDSEGYFLIWGSGISTGTYDVSVQLEAGETSTPQTHTGTLDAGEDLFVGTYTVTGALGTITGTVKSGTNPITTGVLVYASTSAFSGTPVMPPTLNSATRSSSDVYYAVSSNAEGTYTLPVRGGYTYNVYAWYTTWNGDTPVITPKSTTAAVTAGGTVTKDFTW